MKIIDRKKPPKTPAYLLLGLILVNFGPLKKLPNIYPPISVEIHINKITKKINKLFSSKLFLIKKTL